MDAGFGSEDENRIYDKPLFQDRTAANIYKNIREDNDDEEENQKKNLDQILGGDDKAGSKKSKNQGPIEFTKQSDPSFDGAAESLNKKIKKN